MGFRSRLRQGFTVRLPLLGEAFVYSPLARLPKKADLWYDPSNRSWNVVLGPIELTYQSRRVCHEIAHTSGSEVNPSPHDADIGIAPGS